MTSLTLYMLKYEEKNDLTRLVIGGCSIICTQLWHGDDYMPVLMMFILSAAALKSAQLKTELFDYPPTPLLLKRQTSYQEEVSLLEHIWRHSDERRIAIFLTLNLIFLFVEVLYGYWCNSLGLISDSAHMFMDCTALFIGLYASY